MSGDLQRVRPEQIEQKPVEIGSHDRAWMESVFGCEWPTAEEEVEWLHTINQLVVTGDQSLRRGCRSSEHEAYRTPIIDARWQFFARLPGLSAQTLQSTRDRYSPDTIVSPSIFTEAQRYLYSLGINGLDLVKAAPPHLGLSAARWKAWIEGVEAAGLPARTILQAAPRSAGLSVYSVLERVAPMHAAARASGMPDYRQAVRGLIESFPSAINVRPDKTRTLARIVTQASLEIDDWQVVKGLYILPLEASVVAYLERRDVLRSMTGLRYQARIIHEQRSKAELVAAIAAEVGSDDPVIKAYLKGYPIDDPAAVQQVWQRHVRARERRREYPLLWQGPVLLGDPSSMSAFTAYKYAVQSPDLTDAQFNQIVAHIAGGHEAEERLRQLDQDRSRESISQQTEQYELGVRARRALLARYLKTVVEISEGVVRSRSSRSEVLATGNVALVDYVLHDYQPAREVMVEHERRRFERGLVRSVMWNLTGYYPKYHGKTLKELEAYWAAEDQEPVSTEAGLTAGHSHTLGNPTQQSRVDYRF